MDVPHHERHVFDDLVQNNVFLNHQCLNCDNYGFPCMNCLEYVYHYTITPEILLERIPE